MVIAHFPSERVNKKKKKEKKKEKKNIEIFNARAKAPLSLLFWVLSKLRWHAEL